MIVDTSQTNPLGAGKLNNTKNASNNERNNK